MVSFHFICHYMKVTLEKLHTWLKKPSLQFNKNHGEFTPAAKKTIQFVPFYFPTFFAINQPSYPFNRLKYFQLLQSVSLLWFFFKPQCFVSTQQLMICLAKQVWWEGSLLPDNPRKRYQNTVSFWQMYSFMIFWRTKLKWSYHIW